MYMYTSVKPTRIGDKALKIEAIPCDRNRAAMSILSEISLKAYLTGQSFDLTNFTALCPVYYQRFIICALCACGGRGDSTNDEDVI